MLCKVEVPVMHSNTGALLPGQVLDKGTIRQIKKKEMNLEQALMWVAKNLFCKLLWYDLTVW